MEENQLQIPDGWDETNVNEISISINDKRKQIKSSEYLELGSFPVIDQSEKFICGFTDEKDKVIFEKLPVTIFGDHTRHTKFINFPFVCGADGTQVLKPKEKVDDKFYYYLISNASTLIGNHGYDRHFKHLKEFKTTFPKDKTEQQTVANILSITDQAIVNTEALIAKYTRIKTGLMQDLLTKGIDENGNIRSEQTHQFKDSPLGRIPKEWECEVLRSYVSYISYGFTNPMPESLEGPYLITAANINKGRILYETSRKTTYKAYKELLTQKSRPIINDVLITKDGSIGRLAIVDSENLCINQSVAIMRVRNEKVDSTYFKMLLESNKYQDLIMADSGGSTIKHIYITKIDKMFLAIPTDSNEQTRILSILKSQDEIIEITQNQLSKLQSLKTGLMQDLLSGKVRVNNLMKEKQN